MFQINWFNRRVGIVALAGLLLFSNFAGFLPNSANAGSKSRPDGLTVKTDDAGSVTTAAYFTWNELQALPTQHLGFSSVDSMPAPVFTAANAVTLREIIKQSGVNPETVSSFKIVSNDEMSSNVSKSKFYGMARYYYPNLYSCFDSALLPAFKPGIEAGLMPTEPSLALQSYQARSITAPQFDKMDELNSPRLCFGQKDPSEVITGMYSKWVKEIVLSVDPSAISAWLNEPLPYTTYKTGDVVMVAGRAQNVPSLNITIRDYAGNQVVGKNDVLVNGNTFSSSIILPESAPSGVYSVTVADGTTILAVSTFSYEKKSSQPVISEPLSGQKIKQGAVVAFKGSAPAGTLLHLLVFDPSSKKVLDQNITVGNDWQFAANISLAADATLGNYTVQLLVGSAVIQSFNIIVEGSTASGTVDPSQILTITGDGLSSSYKFSLATLESMTSDMVSHVYSTVSRLPESKLLPAKGIPLKALLEKAGVSLGSVGLVTISASDGYSRTMTKNELFDISRYAFPNIMSGSTGGKQVVEPLIALETGPIGASLSDITKSNPKFYVGQRSMQEQTNNLIVKDVCSINLSSSSPESWEKATADPLPASATSITGITLKSSGDREVAKIYYTLDGSTPTTESKMFNVKTEGNEPIKLTQDTTIKAIVIGAGKNDSDVVAFDYKLGAVASTEQVAQVKAAEAATIALGQEAVIDIPAGAIAGADAVAVKIIRIIAPNDLLGTMKLGGGLYELTVNDKHDFKFLKPVVLKFKYDSNLLAADEIPTICYYDELTKKWINVGGKVTDGYITVSIDHFTKFAVMVIKGDRKVMSSSGISVELSDIKGHWAEKSILQLCGAGAIGGYPDGTFRPNDRISRAEFAALLVKALHIKQESGNSFADMEGHWSSQLVATAAAHGIVSGVSDSTFAPNQPVTREQMASMLSRASGFVQEKDKGVFSDTKTIAPWAGEAIATVVANGIMGGYPDGSFHPVGNASRAEAVTAIAKCLQKTAAVQASQSQINGKGN